MMLALPKWITSINVPCLVVVKVEPTVNSSYEWKYLLVVLRNSFPAAPVPATRPFQPPI